MSALICATCKQFTQNVDKNPNCCRKGICRQVNHAEINSYLVLRPKQLVPLAKKTRVVDLTVASLLFTSYSDQIFTRARFQMSLVIFKVEEE